MAENPLTSKPPAVAWALLLLLVGLVMVAPTLASAAPNTVTPAESANPLSIPAAITLGVVEGVTEYLPVSSTGHLLVAERLMGLGVSDSDKAAFDTYTVVIQIGAIIAVLGIYRRRFALMIQGAIGRSDEGRRLIGVLLVAFLPAAVIGKLAGDSIKEHLLAPWPIVGAWALGGLAILAFDRFKPGRAQVESVANLPIAHAAVIGAAQTLALWPGVSRSLVTILAAVAIGMTMSAAVEFSFLLGFITLSAATVYELAGNGSTIVDTFGYVSPIVGIIVAGIAAFASVRFMIDWLNRRGLALFGWYRLGAAALVTVLLLGGVLDG